MRVLETFIKHEPCVETVRMLLNLLQVKVTVTTLQEDLLSHPDYPSLLSISDVLTTYGVENMSVRINLSKLRTLPQPSIVPIRSANDLEDKFVVVANIGRDFITLLNPDTKKEELITTQEFENTWVDGIAMIIDSENAEGEADFPQQLKKERQLITLRVLGYSLLPAMIILSCINSYLDQGVDSLLSILFTMLTLIGAVTGLLLIQVDLNEYSPFLKRICGNENNSGCGAVLNSKHAQVYGIKWSVIGFSYFLGGLFSILVFGVVDPANLRILAWATLLTIPYILFSLFYQAFVIRQWCRLCVTVQFILIAQTILQLQAGWMKNNIATDLDGILQTSFFWVLGFALTQITVFQLMKSKEHNNTRLELQRLKHDPKIFEALLLKQKTIQISSDGLGISLGNVNAKNRIVKVCNPYCGPCAKAHIPIDDLIRNNPDVHLQIIFTASEKEDDIRNPPVKHLLAIAESGVTSEIHQALNDWYRSDVKDYDTFASKHALQTDLSLQDAKVTAMRQWCDESKIAFTPTIYINGYQLPDMYSATDLKYFLSV